MAYPPPPCWVNGVDCSNRCVGCQISCEKYLAYKEKLEAVHKKQNAERIAADYSCQRIVSRQRELKNTEAGKRALAQR